MNIVTASEVAYRCKKVSLDKNDEHLGFRLDSLLLAIVYTLDCGINVSVTFVGLSAEFCSTFSGASSGDDCVIVADVRVSDATCEGSAIVMRNYTNFITD